MTGMGSCQPAGKEGCGSGGPNLSAPKLGEVLVKKENIITFKDGLLGFEDLREFVILDIEEWRPFEWLVSVENPDVTFP
ncbi:MAG: flagellar assembly protein FliW, partial [Planctomycetota bacterium]